MSKTRNFFWPAAQSSQLLEFVAREKNFSGIYINLLTFLGARPLHPLIGYVGTCAFTREGAYTSYVAEVEEYMYPR